MQGISLNASAKVTILFYLGKNIVENLSLIVFGVV